MNRICASLIALSLVVPATAAQAQAQTIANTAVPPTLMATPGFERFTPRPSRTTRLDFEIWDVALKEFVLYGGPSLRKRAERPKPVAGSRLVIGHTSPFRNEGNKVMFEGMRRGFESNLGDYVDDLVAIGNRIDIATLPRNEQLAYWLNLHNALVVREIAKRYPIQNPTRIRGKDKLGFHDTKLITVSGVPLSLRNIREDIVFANWDNPVVIYGFFRGDLGSPSLQRAAYDGRNVYQTLGTSAREFAGSLRGVEVSDGVARVSKVYEEAAPYYFKDFDGDLRAHLEEFSSPDALADVRRASAPLTVAKYETVIADLSGGYGDREPISAVRSRNPRTGAVVDNSAIGRTIREQNEKYEEIRQRGLSGVVIIEDIETDPDNDFIDLSDE